MNRRFTARQRYVRSHARRIERSRSFDGAKIELLEPRAMLSAVTWTINQAASSLTMSMPATTLNIGVQIKPINQDSLGNGVGTSWTTNKTAPLGGTLLTEYVDG